MSGPNDVPVHINADFSAVLSNYPAHTQLPPALAQFMKKLGPGNTSCCVQMCHAFNLSGIKVPSGNFRPQQPTRVASEIPEGSGNFYLLAVDEMINYMTGRFGAPLVLGAVKSVTQAEVKKVTAPVQGIEGVMTFGEGHIELWNRFNIEQDNGPMGMDANFLWGKNKFGAFRIARFWRMGNASAQRANPLDAMLLNGWWDVNDGNQYYYFIDVTVGKVWYTKRKPHGPLDKIGHGALNSGDVTIAPDNSVVMDWNPADGGATRETFQRNFADLMTMRGTSNRYGPLTATKMRFV